MLARVGERYTRLRELSRQVGPGAMLEGVSRTGNLATERWPAYLRGDLMKIEARLSAEGSA